LAAWQLPAYFNTPDEKFKLTDYLRKAAVYFQIVRDLNTRLLGFSLIAV
jgi:hypothetical protein